MHFSRQHDDDDNNNSNSSSSSSSNKYNENLKKIKNEKAAKWTDHKRHLRLIAPRDSTTLGKKKKKKKKKRAERTQKREQNMETFPAEDKTRPKTKKKSGGKKATTLGFRIPERLDRSDHQYHNFANGLTVSCFRSFDAKNSSAPLLLCSRLLCFDTPKSLR